MRVALVHDDLAQWGGAERVLVALSEIFPEAPIYTLVYDKSNKILKDKFSGKKIITSFLQQIPGWKTFYKPSFFLHPIAFEQFDFSAFDLVISQTTRFAKSIVTRPGTIHICYCHTPPRFLYNFSGELGWLGKLGMLRDYDQVLSKRVDFWVAGSKNAQERIQKVYGMKSRVIYPFVDWERFEGVETFEGGYLLVVSRLNRYKRVDLVVKAANRLKVPLKIVGVGPELKSLEKMAGPNVQFLGNLDEETLSLVISGCIAMVVAGEEDFGLTPLEAQALGKPVIAYKKGGVLETVLPNITGYLFDDQSVESLVEALQALDKTRYNQKRCKEQALEFSKQRFMREFQSLTGSLWSTIFLKEV